MHVTVHKCITQYSTQQFWLSSRVQTIMAVNMLCSGGNGAWWICSTFWRDDWYSACVWRLQVCPTTTTHVRRGTIGRHGRGPATGKSPRRRRAAVVPVSAPWPAAARRPPPRPVELRARKPAPDRRVSQKKVFRCNWEWLW